LVATVLSRNAEPKWTDTLIGLLEDADADVARQAAPGLGRIGDKKARDPLIAKIREADNDSRKLYLEALRDGVGGAGLVLALYSVQNEEDVQNKWFVRKEIFQMLDELNDPRAADALVEYLQVEDHIHYQYRTAKALAQIGDARAVPVLAKRLRMDPEKIYSDDYDWEMLIKRDGKERVKAARMIADLAVLNPDKIEQMREQAEDALIFWNNERTQPHANGLRALVNLKSTKDIEQLRAWSNPDEPLPKEGQQPPMPDAFVIAQSALRYVGVLKDEKSWSVLLDMLKKKPDTLSIANESMYQGGLAILGMSLNAIGKGASDGLSEWADPKGFEPLMEFIEDPKQNENAREAACAALAWTADSESIMKVAEKISEYAGEDHPNAFRRRCFLETLVQRPVPGTAKALMTLMTKDQAIETRTNLARAIAKAGIDAETQSKLIETAKDPALMNDAVLALALGGTPDEAARAIALFAGMDKVAIEQLKDMWYKSFGYWSTEDLKEGVIFRYVDNAEAISRVVINATPQVWAAEKLTAQFENLIFDNGPHSFTRVVLRNELFNMGKGSDAAKAAGAVRTLKFMNEKGVLMALRDAEGPVAKLADDAVFELNNPNLFARGAGTKAADEKPTGALEE
jgi:HEAT repeat protein